MFFKTKAKINQDLKVSVIIPLYNHENFIKEAITSVLNQTYKNIELIVIDDGSRDNSLAIAKSFEDDRIQVLTQQNQGAHYTINRGLELATGDFLTILNSDDIYEKNRIEKCVGYLIQHPHVHLVCTYIKIIDHSGKTLGIKEGWKNMEPWPIPNKSKSYAGSNNFSRNLLVSNFISTTSNMVFTKKLYQEIGGMRNLRFAHDWDFALRAAEYGECSILEEALIKYRIHETNTISSNRKHMLFEICWIYAANLPRFESHLILQESSKEELEQLAESINLQGNDKLLWILRSSFNASQKRGVKDYELAFLENKELRESLFKYIVE
ncbi:cell wall biosynthesis glycosyltransferase [Paenibacillus stellifer]|uniref:Cell wall biosynthesis glycosyltransferase n=1 Tax=Paenibacillus stellifer TaxID=169760 RepID=A0A089NAB9_9BACL|nr:glycosyltransferase [Paenibacillus stellifer]AIQ65804.1 cell wall biosynthesis glycosyltransferase [Paenibacillus stellifer]